METVKNPFWVSPLAPISANALFPASLIDNITFQLWTRKGVGLVRNVFRESSFISFQQLRAKLNIPQSNFFRYLQDRSFIKKHSPSLQNLQSSWLDECLKVDPLQGGVCLPYMSFCRRQQPPLWTQFNSSGRQN